MGKIQNEMGSFSFTPPMIAPVIPPRPNTLDIQILPQNQDYNTKTHEEVKDTEYAFVKIKRKVQPCITLF